MTEVRDTELTRLILRIDEARISFIVGEPGIGKTSLVDSAAAMARLTGIRVLRGRASRIDTASMRPFAEALLGLARSGWSPGDDLGPYRAVLGQFVPEWRVEDSVEAEPSTIAEAVLRVLGETGACVSLLILEDLHDADQDTISVLAFLLDNAAREPLAIVCTTRDITCPALALAEDASRRDRDSVIVLDRLDQSATGELAAVQLGTEQRFLDGELRENLFRDSLGNPLMLNEILRDLVADGALSRRRDGMWTLHAPQRRRTPTGLSQSIANQLRGAGPAAGRVLQAAAVIGGKFPTTLIGAAAEVSGEDLERVFDFALRAQLFVPVGRPGWFAYRHPLLEQSVHDLLVPDAFAATALAAAAAIEESALNDQEWRVRAAALRESAGDKAGAGELFAEAGYIASDNDAPSVAVDLLQRALECMPANRFDLLRAKVVGTLVTTLGTTGRSHDALRLAPEIDQATRSDLPREVVADLHLRLARATLHAHSAEQTLSRVHAARLALGDTRADAQRAEMDAIEARLAADRRPAAHGAEAEFLAKRSIERARAASTPAVECDALLTLGRWCSADRPEAALACYQQADRIAQANNLTVLRSAALRHEAEHRWLWHVDQRGFQSALTTANASGAVAETLLAQLSLAAATVCHADFDTARDLWKTAWDDVARLRLPKLASYASAVKVLMHAHRGEGDELAAAVAEIHQWRGGIEGELPLVLGNALGMAALLRGDLAVGRAHLDGLRVSNGGRHMTYHLCGGFGLAALVEVCEGAVSWSRLREIMAEPAGRMPWNNQFIQLAQAILSGRSGDMAGAEAAFDHFRQVSEPFPVARHLGLRLTASNADRDGWGSPTRWLQEAADFFGQAGIQTAARSCRDELHRLGGRAQPWHEESPEVPRALRALGVTPREHEVLRLLTRHLTNREIAARLQLSHRTVEGHVARLLAKTGSTTRRDLAAWLTSD